MRLGDCELRLDDVMQHEEEKCDVQGFILDRERFELTVSHGDIVEPGESSSSCADHCRGIVDRDNTPSERRDDLAELAGAASEIADLPGLIDQSKKPYDICSCAKELASQ